MKKGFYFGFILVIISCGVKKDKQIVITTSHAEFVKLMEDDKFEGVVILKDKNGKLKEQFIHTSQNSIGFSFDSTASNIVSMEMYDKDYNGSSIDFYPTGTIQTYYRFQSKKKNGDCVKFWDNGLISEINRYKIINEKDFLNEQINFFKDGQVKESSQFMLTEFAKKEGSNQLLLHITPVGNVFENSFYRIVLSNNDTILSSKNGFYIPISETDSLFKAVVEEVVQTDSNNVSTQKIKKVYLDYINK